MDQLYNQVPLVKNFVQFVDGIFFPKAQTPFIIRTMDYKKTASEREVVLEFSGLVKLQDFEDGIDISYYPVVNGEIGNDGLYKTEGAAFVLVVHIQFKHGLSVAERNAKKQSIMEQMRLLMVSEQNLYIEQQANMPQAEENVRIVSVRPIDVDKIIDGLRFEIPFKTVRFIDPTLAFDPAKPSITPEYQPIDHTGTANATDVPANFDTGV